MNMKLKGKVALITGSVTGIGKAIALKFAHEGATTVINYSKSQVDADAMMRELAHFKAMSILIKADVSKDEEVREMVMRTVERFKRLDILVNNAGITHFVPSSDLDGLTEEIWDKIFAVNVKGAFFCVRAAAPVMRRQGVGCVINLASVAGIDGRGSSIAYCASKAALISLTKSLAHALAPEIRVNAIAPGFVPTRWNLGRESWHQSIIQETPLRRLTQPDDIASLALAMVTDAPFITGQTIVVDGGKTM